MNTRFFLILFGLICFLLSRFPARGQETKPMVVEHADSLVGKTIGGEAFRELIGHVRLRQDNVSIRCDRAIQFLDRNQVELLGNVVITQDTLTLKTSHGLYFGNTRLARSSAPIEVNDGSTTLTAASGEYDVNKKTAVFIGDVTVDDPRTKIHALHLVYERDSSKAIATGNVEIAFKEDNAFMLGDSVVQYIRRKVTFVSGSPYLRQIDSTFITRRNAPDSLRLDTLHMLSGRMEAYRDSTNTFIARDSVRILRGELAARAELAVMFRNDSLAVLRYDPVVWYRDTQITADSIAVTFSSNAVEKMEAHREAFAASKSKPESGDTLGPPGRFDQTEGNVVSLFFSKHKLHRIEIEGNAISLYWLYDGRALNGVRRESGDRMVITFKDGKADVIRTAGGVEGVYYPEKLVANRESTFNLEGFHWRADRPAYSDLPSSFQHQTATP
ncbi:MAG: LPS export ABC transporter periplasmic protein LptC [Chlorobi bacterium]|nr:LPS export ABC transporter periplasmic protein LptC [Chlorobiota bacterium]